MPLTIKQIETALKATGGFVSQTAKKLNCTQAAFYKLIEQSEYLRKVKHDIDESYLDLAESKFLKKINDEDLGSLCFYLKCKGKGRGYVEKPKEQIELTTTNQEPTTIKIVMGSATEVSRNESNTDKS